MHRDDGLRLLPDLVEPAAPSPRELTGVHPPPGPAGLVEHKQPAGGGPPQRHERVLGADVGPDDVPGGQLDVLDPAEVEPLEGGAGADEVGDEVVGRGGQDPLGGVVLRDARPLLQDRDPVAHLDGLVDVVRDEDDGLADLGLQAQELVLQPLAQDRVDGPEGLVHEHHVGVAAERTGDADALHLPAGQLLRVAVAVLPRRHVHHLKQLVDAVADPLLVPAEQLGHGGDVLGDGHVREQPDALDDVADAASQLVRVALGHVLPVEDDASGGRLDDAVDHLHGGGLAAAGRPDQDHDLALGHLEGEAVNRRLALTGEPLGQLLEADHGAVARWSFLPAGSHLRPLDVVSRRRRMKATWNRTATTTTPSRPARTRLTATSVPTR